MQEELMTAASSADLDTTAVAILLQVAAHIPCLGCALSGPDAAYDAIRSSCWNPPQLHPRKLSPLLLPPPPPPLLPLASCPASHGRAAYPRTTLRNETHATASLL
eukprot:442628-Rhodomonas_salina.2